MNGKELLFSFADISEEKLSAACDTAAVRRSFRRERARRIRAAAVCGCAAMALAAAFFGARQWFDKTPAVTDPGQADVTEQQTAAELQTQHDLLPQPGTDATGAGYAPPETAPAPSTDSTSAPPAEEPMTAAEPAQTPAQAETAFEKQYVYRLTDPVYAGYTPGKVIAPEKVGEKLADATATAGWTYADGTEAAREELRCEVFRITGVDPAVAVCVRFLDKGEALTTDHYYVQYDPAAEGIAKISEYIIPTALSDSGEE